MIEATPLSLHSGLSLRSVKDVLHTARITQAVNCLTSKDKIVNDVAWSQLQHAVKKGRLLADVSANDITDFLNTSPLPQERRSRDVTSIWSTIKKSLNYTSCTVSLDTTSIYWESDDQQIHAG